MSTLERWGTGLVLGMVLLLSGCATTREDLDGVERECREVLSAQVKAWNAGDIESFLEGYVQTKELTFVSKKVNRGYAQAAQAFRDGYPDRGTMGRLRFEDLTVRALTNNDAIVTGAYRLADTTRGESGGRFTLLMRREAEGMRILYDHTSREGEEEE